MNHNDKYLVSECTGEPLHREIYRKRCGPIPPGYHIHHIDKNPKNNDPQNLIAVTEEFHATLHELDRNKQGIPKTKAEVRLCFLFYLKGKDSVKNKPKSFDSINKFKSKKPKVKKWKPAIRKAKSDMQRSIILRKRGV